MIHPIKFWKMHNPKEVQNTLATEVVENGWLRRKLPFKSFTSDDILDFPEVTGRHLKILFTGSYLLSQVVSYSAGMMDKDGKLKIQFVEDQSNILKLKVPSHHISRKAYRCFLRCFLFNSIVVSGMMHHTCECANEKRTVGCCSHIAAIDYYLSHARCLSKIFKPAEILSHVFKKNNYIPVIESDSDED